MVKKSRRRRSCKYGELKSPVKTAKGGKRYCKLAPKKSRRKSAAKSRRRKSSRNCKHGVLKNPVKLPSGNKRYCKLAPKKGKRKSAAKSRRKSAAKSRRKSAAKSRRRKSSRNCKHGELKSPIKTAKGGKRYCKLAPKKGRRKSAAKSRRKSAAKSRRKSAAKSRRKSAAKSRRKSAAKSQSCVDLARYGVNPSERRKYGDRKGPPFPAVPCEGQRKRGNDGLMYIAEKRGKAKSPRWYKVVNSSGKSSAMNGSKSSEMFGTAYNWWYGKGSQPMQEPVQEPVNTWQAAYDKEYRRCYPVLKNNKDDHLDEVHRCHQIATDYANGIE